MAIAMPSFEQKLNLGSVLAALEKLRAEKPELFDKMDTFIFRNPAGWSFTAAGLGALLPGNDNRDPAANRGRGNLFLGKEIGVYFGNALDVNAEIDARPSDRGENIGKALSVFTWESVNICNGGESGTESEVTFVLRPEYSAAYQLLSKPEKP